MRRTRRAAVDSTAARREEAARAPSVCPSDPRPTSTGAARSVTRVAAHTKPLPLNSRVVALAPGSAIGKYTVVRKIAEGGMAEVYLAHQIGPADFSREICVKRIREHLSKDLRMLEYFVSEARLAASLVHPNILPVYDFDKDGDAYYLAMEFVHGRNLAQIVHEARKRKTPLSPFLVLHVVHEVAKALGHAHRYRSPAAPRGVVHRDVTPQNVLVTYEGLVKLADFGIAKAVGQVSTAGTLKGKFAYMSPEQARGDDVDVRTDVFALGIVLWELLTGQRLFLKKDDARTLEAVRNAKVVPPSESNPAVPPDLSAVVVHALAKEPKERFQDGDEMAKALRAVLFAHPDEAARVDLGRMMRDLFGDPSDETEVVPVPVPRPPPLPGRGAVVEGPPPLGEGPLIAPPNAPTAIRPPVLPEKPPPPDAAAATTERAPMRFVSRRRVAAAACAAAALAAIAWIAVRARSTPVPAAASPATSSPSASAGTEEPEPRPPAATPVLAVQPASGSPPAAASTPTSEAVPAEEPRPPAPVRAPAPSAAAAAATHRASTHKTAATTGTLEVIVTPWAKVLLDGAPLGDAPGHWAVAPGRHLVQVLNPEAGINEASTVAIVAGKRQVLRLGR